MLVTNIGKALKKVPFSRSDLQTIDFARLLKTECGFGFTPPPMAAAATAASRAAAAAPKL